MVFFLDLVLSIFLIVYCFNFDFYCCKAPFGHWIKALYKCLLIIIIIIIMFYGDVDDDDNDNDVMMMVIVTDNGDDDDDGGGR